MDIARLSRLHKFRFWDLFMSIAIVSALPKSAPAQTSATNAAAGTGSADSGRDFSSLFGQLSARLGAGLNPGDAPESAANDSAGGGLEANDENAELAEPGDPLALLAALTQASLEQRDKITPGAAPGDESPATGAGTGARGRALASSGDEILPDKLTARDAAEVLSAGQKPTPANEQAANFAAKLAVSVSMSPDRGSGETAAALSGTQETSGISTPTVAAGVSSQADKASAAVPVPLPTSVYDRNWNNDFAQKVTWIATQNKQFAELTLNPPSMGSIEISLKLDNDKSTATATFFSSNAEVRETIETSLPRLREMLAGAGIQLGQAHVGAESFRQTSGHGQGPGEGAPSPSGNDADILASDQQAARIAASAIAAGRGMVDMFV
jgi:flagellar hook-length control protein FliK